MDANTSCYPYSDQIFFDQSESLYIQNCDSDAASFGNECCKYQCIMSNAIHSQSAVQLCPDMADSYFACMQKLNYNALAGFERNATLINYEQIGRISTTVTISCCVAVLLIAVLLQSYKQWAEQIILSKTMFVLGFGISLFISFHGKCNFHFAAVTSSFILGDLLWTIVLLWVLKNTANRPFQQISFTKGILFYWIVVCAVCSAYGYGFLQFLRHYHVGGYMQYVPICLVSRTVAINSTSLGFTNDQATVFANANWGLIGFVYLPYMSIFIVNILGVFYIWRRFSSSASHSSNSARLRVLSTIRKYLGWFAIYTIILVVFYSVGFNVHSCPDSTYIWSSDMDSISNKRKTIQNCLKFPPPCVSWQGYTCDSASRNKNLNYAQYVFFALFCLRGVPDLLVFIYLNRSRIIERIRDREYQRNSGQSTFEVQRSDPLLGSAGVQSFNIAHKIREDIMAYTQAGIKKAAYDALLFHSQDKNNGRRSQTYDPNVPVNRADYDESWVPLMVVSSEECRAQVSVVVDDLNSMALESSLKDLAFTDVAPKAFLQIRHAAGLSSREYADTLGRTNVQMDHDQEMALVEKLTEGRGGAFFYYSYDRRFVIKTITEGEFKVVYT